MDFTPKQIEKLVADKNIHELEANLFQLAAVGGIYKPLVVAMMEIGSPEAWDGIGRFLAQQQTAAVAFTIADLEEITKPGVARALGAALSNPGVSIRLSAARALLRQDTVPRTPHLVRAARDPDPDVSRVARATLVQQMEEEPEAFDGVPQRVMEGVFDLLDRRRGFDLLGEELPETIRVIAAQRVARCADEESATVLSGLLLSVDGPIETACWAGLDASRFVTRELLQALLESDHIDTKARALELLARSAVAGDVEVFEAEISSTETRIRKAALTGLARSQGPESIDVLTVALDDIDDIPVVAINLLGAMEESTPQLLAAIDHPDAELRKRVMLYLADRGVINDTLMPRYLEFIRTGKNCTDTSDGKYIDGLKRIAESLGSNQIREGLDPLADLARSGIRPLRRTAIIAIMKYQPETRADALFSLADTYDQDVLQNVARGLWEIKDGRATIPLIRAMRESRGSIVKLAKTAMHEIEDLEDCDIVTSLLSQPYPSVRRFAAEKLLDFEDPLSIPALLVASTDDDVDVQLAVFEALAPFATEHEMVKERMLKAIGYGDVSVRQAACEALGEARCVEAVPDLIRALSNAFLRRRASVALRRIGDRMGMLAIKRMARRRRMVEEMRDRAKRPINQSRRMSHS